MSEDFDVLVEEARENPTEDSMSKLWGAVYALKEWQFIARGEFPNIHPFVGIIDDKPFVMAFTDGERARKFAVAQGLADSEGNVLLLSIPVEGFISTVNDYIANGVFGILFNEGTAGFFAPLPNLELMLQYFKSKVKDDTLT